MMGGQPVRDASPLIGMPILHRSQNELTDWSKGKLQSFSRSLLSFTRHFKQTIEYCRHEIGKRLSR